MVNKSLDRTFAVIAMLLTAAIGRAADAPNVDMADKARTATTPVPKPASGPMLDKFLDGPLKDVAEIVFAVRVSGREYHWYANFAYYSDDQKGKRGNFLFEDGLHWLYGEGAKLCRLNLRTGKLTGLLADPKGGIRDPQVHYDGRKILFSYRKGGEHSYHLYEILSDGTGLKQLTDGPDDDIEPTYGPDDSLIFCSSRCHRFVNCWWTRVATLYRCDGDGRNIRMLSANIEHDNTPWMLPDGRVLYMRWEYVDRNQQLYHHLWTMNPDGTSQAVYYGNLLHMGIAMLDAKPIPGTGKVVASFSPGHGKSEHRGAVTIVDPRRGPDHVPFARSLNDPQDIRWRDPYPFSEDCFLVAGAPGIAVMDGGGNTELIYQLPPADKGLECHEPRPLVPRPREPVIPPRIDLRQTTGRLILQDIYHGRNMAGVRRGEIKKLLVLKQVPKPVNFSGGPEPLSINGSFTLAEIAGEVPVEPDGSAYLELPALEPFFFVALDEKDLSVKRMQSFHVLQPGESAGCVGCHEQRVESPAGGRTDLLASRRPPSRLQPIVDVPRVLDFPRDVQPILDRHCVACHNPDRREGKVDLCGDKTPMYTISYWAIRLHDLVSDGRNESKSNRPPRSIGSSASPLMQYLDGRHHDVRLPEHDRKVVRLWIETSACYPGTYAALGCGSYPVALPLVDLTRRCGGCHTTTVTYKHGDVQELKFGLARARWLESLCNLSRPEKSLVLRAPLAKEAGGLALCKAPPFAGTDDSLYRHLRAALDRAAADLAAGKRFDMPGFRPNRHYVREMQRFGILPKDLAADAPVDAYAVDRAYWDSFVYRPQQ
jgi:hypothetical protein